MYEWTIEPILKRIKQKIAQLVSRYRLSPVLDLCCGTGKQAHFIHLSGQKVVGLDLNAGMLSFARKRYPEMGWVCADAAHVPFPAGSLKGIILSYALHDKSDHVRSEILNEVRRILAPEGMVIFVDFENPWNGRSRWGSVFTWLIERAAGGEHFKNGRKFLSEGGLCAFIEAQGMSEIKSYDLELGCSSIVLARFV